MFVVQPSKVSLGSIEIFSFSFWLGNHSFVSPGFVVESPVAKYLLQNFRAMIDRVGRKAAQNHSKDFGV